MTRFALFMALVALGCTRDAAAACPASYARDPARVARLRARLAGEGEGEGEEADLPVCFGGASSSLGVLANGQALLARDAPDDALAARLAHLAEHAKDRLGDDGCARGAEAAITSEARASRVERDLRVKWGLARGEGDAEAARERERERDADYVARCGGTSWKSRPKP